MFLRLVDIENAEGTLVSATRRDAEGTQEQFVYIHNDEVSPMKKVIDLARIVFDLPDDDATHVALTVHHKEVIAMGPYPAPRAMNR